MLLMSKSILTRGVISLRVEKGHVRILKVKELFLYIEKCLNEISLFRMELLLNLVKQEYRIRD